MSSKMVMPIVMLLAMGALVTVLAMRRDGGQTDGKGPVIAYAAESVRVIAEAEAAQIESPFVIMENAGASAGKAVEIPENPDESELNPKAKTAEGEPVSWKSVSEDKTYTGKPLYPNGTARIPFTVSEAGEYVLWFRAYWLHGCANSFYFMVDPKSDPVDTNGNGEYDDEVVPKQFDGGGTYKVWHWVQYGKGAEGGKPEVFNLSPGNHTIVMYNREDGIRLDQVLFVTYNPANEYYPTGAEKDNQ